VEKLRKRAGKNVIMLSEPSLDVVSTPTAEDLDVTLEQANEKMDLDTEEATTDGTNFIVEDEWFEGKVEKWKGTYGFILQTGTEDRLFVHRKNVKSNDYHIFLRHGMEVKFKKGVDPKDPEKKRAMEVMSIDGTELSWHKKNGESDDFTRRNLSDGHKFKGVIRRYFPKRNYGWIAPTEPIKIEDEQGLVEYSLFDQVYLCDQDLNCPQPTTQIRIKFDLYRDKRGVGARNVIPMSKEELAKEHKEMIGGYNKNMFSGVEGKRYQGVVTSCKTHHFVLIKPEEDLKMYGISQNIQVKTHELITDSRPARVDVDTKVSFELESNGLGMLKVVRVADENGDPIVCETPYERAPVEERTTCGDKTYQGTIKRFNWTSGIGWIEPTTTVEDEFQSQNKNDSGLIFFQREDLKSDDKVFGVPEKTEVEFQLYTNSKGLGAHIITLVFGETLSGFNPPQRAFYNYHHRHRRGRGGRGYHRGRGRGRGYHRGRGRGRGRGRARRSFHPQRNFNNHFGRGRGNYGQQFFPYPMQMHQPPLFPSHQPYHQPGPGMFPPRGRSNGAPMPKFW